MAKIIAKRAAASATKPQRTPASPVITDTDIARRAYDLYLARGCEHGHDVDDWVNAERELRGASTSVAA